MSLRPEVFEFESDGLHLVGDCWSAEKPRGAVVLLHGGGQTRHSWDRTAERLAVGGWAAFSIDARGHGDSSWHPAADYTLDGFVADLLVLVSALDQPPVLIGASLGGITSLVAAGEHPGLARGLVLVDVVVDLERAGTTRILEFLAAHRDGFSSLEEVAQAVVAYNPQRWHTRFLDGLHKNVRQHADGRWYWHWDPEFIQIGDEPQRRADPKRLRAAASRLRVPTLLVRGAQSDVVSDAGLAKMQQLVPTADSIVIPGAAHMVAGDDNDVFVSGIEAFLDRLD